MNALELIQSRLEERGHRVTWAGQSIRSQCPHCRTSRTDKFKASIGDGGKPLLHCHGGCDPDDILNAIGLTWADVHGGDASHASMPRANGSNGKKTHPTHDDAVKALTWSVRQLHSDARESQRWKYLSARGEHIATVVRFQVGAGKTYRQIRKVPGGWKNEQPNPCPLYRLPELAEHDAPWIFEGEKCADTGWSIGLPSTTTLGGCKQAHKADLTPLDGKDTVTLCPDTGDTDKWVEALARGLAGLSNPPHVRVCRLPLEGDNLDIEDWLEGTATEDDEAIRASLEGFCKPYLRRQESGTSHRVQYRRITSAELDATEYSQEFLIDRTVVAREPLVIAGAKKCLKTSLMIDMGITLAAGVHFLGELSATRACHVAIMSGESGLPTIQETARRIARAAGRKLAELEHLIWSPDLPQFGHVEHMKAFEDFLTADGIEVVMIDPAYLCMPSSDAGNLMAQGALLRSMNDICQRVGAMLVLAHHNTQSSLRHRQTKGGGYEPPELEDIAWAGFQEWARQWILVGRRQKYEPGTGEHALWLNVGGSAGHSALWAVDIAEGVYDPDTPRKWEVGVRSGWNEREMRARKAKRDKNEEIRTRENEWKLKLREVMERHPGGDTKKSYRELAGLNGSQMARATELLDREGRIVTTTVRKTNGRSYEGIKIKPQGQRETTGKASGKPDEDTEGDRAL